MGGYNILIYGGGNCELGGQLSKCFEEIQNIGQCNQVKVFGRVHLFNQSCLNIYGRFEELKKYIDLGGNSGQGGIYEYFYNGNQTIKICEMKTQPITRESFEQFLEMGKERLVTDEMVLILMGQGNLKGIFMDFALEEPGVIEYEDIFECIERVLYPEVTKIHLIMDVGHWNYMALPEAFLKYSFFESIFLYKRSQLYEFLDIKKFIWSVANFGVYYAVRQKEVAGYWIDLKEEEAFRQSQIMWQFWKGQSHMPTILQETYGKFVKPIHTKQLDNADFKELMGVGSDKAFGGIKDYFSLQYGIIIDEQNLSEWLESLKICTDYHKL